MIADRPASSPEFIQVLTQAACAFRDRSRDRPSDPNVVSALLAAETAAKQQRLNYPVSALLGQWRLCFTASKRSHRRGEAIVGGGRYLPQFVPARISFDAVGAAAGTEGESEEESEGKSERVTIGNQVQVGLLCLKLTGPAQYPGKKNLLAFDFTQMQLTLGNRSLYRGNIRGGAAQAAAFDQRPISTLPFFAFFLLTPDLIAARGRGGGLALWVRE